MPIPRTQAVPAPLTIERARGLLGDEADSLTDDEVRELCEQADELAFIVVRMFMDSRRQEHSA